MKPPYIAARLALFVLATVFLNQKTNAQSPGAVSTNLELWLKANTGTTLSGSDVTTWADQANSNDMTQGTTGNQPDLVAEALNFNAAIDFDGTDDWLDGAAVLTGGDDSFTFIAVWESDVLKLSSVFEQNSNSVVAGQRASLLTQGGGTYGFNGEANDSYMLSYAANSPTITSLVLDGTNINGYHRGAGSAGSINFATQTTGTGAFAIARKHPGASEYFDGRIAEIIVYSVDLSAADRQKIESYLAIKYGITIDQGSARNYLASDGGIIWNATTNATYTTDITGIGRDDNSALNQLKSKSINTNAILTVANGDITSPTAFGADDSFLIWGSNNGVTTFGSGNINNADGTTSNRMGRIWKVQETGTVGNVEISFSNASYSGTMSIVIDPSDNTFANNANRRVIEMVDNGTDYEVTVDFQDGDLFSFVNASVSAITSKPALINEVVTDPQQSWSSGNFYNASPGGAGVDGTDEWIEIYIGADGLNLSTWTIELLDGTNITGDLSNTGAFDVSNYLSLTGGTFTNTKIGDYLILGTVDASGSMDNTGLTVNLKNGSGLVIDQVLIGTNTPSGNSSGISDESVARIPGQVDTNDNSVDFSLTKATLGTTNSPSGTVKINEVVTDPQQDWSSISFNGSAPAGTGTDGEDEWIELYIGSSGINLTGWTITLPTFSGNLTSAGAFEVSNYVASGGGSFTDTRPGDYLVLGNPVSANTMNDNVLVVLYDASGAEIDRVQLGGGASEAPSGNASSINDESVSRYVNAIDSNTDDVDFIRTIASLGISNSVSGTVVINEVVTNPQQDWSTNGFNGTVAGGSVDDGTDEWVELYIGTAGINLTNWTITLTDGTNVSGDLTATGAFDVINYSGSGSFLNTAVGDYLVLGTVDGGGAMDDNVQITLRDASGSIVDQVQLGGGAGEAPTGASTGTSDESVARIPNATDTNVDDTDFVKATASIGTTNSLVSLPGAGNGLDFDGTDDYVLIPHSSDFNLTTSISLEAWINTSSSAEQYISTKNNDSWYFSVNVTVGKAGIYLNGPSAGWLYSTSNVNDGTWHHIAATYDGSTMRIFVDGVLENSSTVSSSINTGTAQVEIGSRGLSYNFDGIIDEFRIWSDERTQEELLENMFSTLAGAEAGLVAYYNFDQSSGTSLPDLVGSNDGTLTNMTGTEWTAAGWETFLENAAILQSVGPDASTKTSGELSLGNVSFLNDDGDFVLVGHGVETFTEVTTDLPAGTLVTARIDRSWYVHANDAAGTTNGNITFAFDIGSAPNADTTYYLLERAGTSGDFSIVPVIGVNPSGTSVIFTLNVSQLDNGSYYTMGRSDGGVGNALDFDGTDDYVVIQNPTSFDFGTGDFTLEAWINVDNGTSAQVIISDDDGSSNGNTLWVENNEINMAIASGAADLTTTSTPIVDGQWHHVVVVRSGDDATIYVDGVPEVSTSGLSARSLASGQNLNLGRRPTGSADYFNGILDEIRIWDDVRTQVELVTNMHESLAGDDTNLIAYFRANQGIGNSDISLPDLSGDLNFGTLNNFDVGTSNTVSNYVPSTRVTLDNTVIIVNGGALTNNSDELTITSSETAGDFLQDSGDQIIWGNDGAAFTEAATDLPSGTLVATRMTKTWNIDKSDVIGTAGGNLTLSFDLGTAPNPDYTYYLLERTGTSGNFSIVEVIGTAPSGNSIVFSVDGAQITDSNYFTLGRSGSGPGNALDFDGTDDYVISTLDGTSLTTLTVEMWINEGVSQSKGIFQWANALGAGTPFVYFNDNSGTFRLYVNGGYRISTSISAGTWHHMAATYDGTTWRLYKDGFLVGNYVGGTTNQANAASVYLANGFAGYWDGQIDEVRIWSDARTRDEIEQNMHRTLDVANESNLLAYYTLNQGIASGDNSSPSIDLLMDQSGNDNSGDLTNFTLTGGATNWVASLAVISDANSAQSLIGPGNALDFDGINDYVIVPDNATLETSSLLTVEAWIRPTLLNANYRGIAARTNTTVDASSVFVVYIGLSNNLTFSINEADINEITTTSGVLTVNEWIHMAGVADGTNVLLYLNGVLVATTPYDGTIVSTSTRDLFLGKFRTEDNFGSFIGQLDEVRIWNAARTAVQIQDNMFKELTGSETGLQAYYRFDELAVAGSTSLPDHSANTNTGTLTNMTPASDWVSATAREPFKTTNAGNFEDDTTWKGRAEPNATSAKLDIAHDITLTSGTLSADLLNLNSGATLTLNSGQSLTSDNDIINNGTIAGAGTLILSGTAPRITGGTFGNVQLSASSPTLQGNTTITGNLNLNTSNLFILDEYDLNVGSISNYGASAYIQTLNQNSSGGALRRSVANGAGQIVFPVGTSSYTPFSMVNLGASAAFTIRVFDGTYVNGTSGAAHVTTEEINRTWAVNAIGSGYNTTISIQWNTGEEDVTFDRTQMFLSRNDSDGWWRPITGTFAASGTNPYTASASGVTSFSEIGGGSGASPLPVELLNFSVQTNDGVVDLFWRTATERNNDRFEIERSADGNAFHQIGQVKGNGDSDHEISYAFTDAKPLIGLNFYRLKQVDFDGSFDYSPIRVAQVGTSFDNQLTVFPNPSRNTFTIRAEKLTSTNVSLSVVDLMGRVVERIQLVPEGTTMEYQFGENLESGLYVLLLKVGNREFVSRVVKE